MAVERKRRDIIFFTIITLLFFYMGATLLFGNMGYLKYSKLKKVKGRLESEITGMDTENKALRARVSALKDDSFSIEKYAREEYGMARPDEYIFQFNDDGR